jgi:hypothetical protein
MEDLQSELMTMKIMIFSLHKSIEDIIKAFDKSNSVTPIDEWEKECKKQAKKIIKESESEK